MLALGWLLLIAISVACAAIVGYAARCASICAVSGVEQLMQRRSPGLFLSFLSASLWVAAICLPLVWLLPGTRLAANHWPTIPVLGGAFLFGIGAAINGGCSFGTAIRLASGDLSFLGTLAGMIGGFALQNLAEGRVGMPIPDGPSILTSPEPWSLLLVGLLWAWCIAQLFRMRRTSGVLPNVRLLQRSVALMGIAGGILYALHGSWLYTVALDRGLATGMGEIPNMLLFLLFASLLGGAMLAARRERLWHLRFNVPQALGRVGAGLLMGFGAGLVPGGNDALLLHALPALSAHAVPAYVALNLGIVVAILAVPAYRTVAGLTLRAVRR